MNNIETDILIIGGGVAGSAMACGLRNRGYKVILIEKSDKPQDTARGDHIQPYVCEILERWGGLDDFFQAGAEKRGGSLWYDSEGTEIMNANVSKLDIPHPYFLYLNHENISEVFLQLASQDKNFRLLRPIFKWNHIETNSNGSLFTVKLRDKTELNIKTKLIVGADGIASHVSKSFGFTRMTYRYERALAVLFSSEYIHDAKNNLKTYITNQGIVAMIPRVGGGCKIGITIDRKEVKIWKKLSNAELSNKISSLVPEYKNLKVSYGGIYPPTMISNEKWVKDNLVLIGDACHGLHPGRSQGMNTSIKCIDNLIENLPSKDKFQSKEIFKSLKSYEISVKPMINDILDKNHKIGLGIDKFDKETKEKEINLYKQIQQNNDSSYKYRMNSAGYGAN
jgi:2-polyprenyl-6-methoxyphenol hydroxylase-like FAD-dependent oxidoreductase